MKKIVPILLVMVMVFGLLTGCGSSNTSTPVSSSDTNDNVVVDNTTTQKNGKQETEGTLGNYYVKFTGCEMVSDYEGKPALLVHYDFTNNSEETICAWAAIGIQAFQDGVQLEVEYAGDGFGLENEDKEIRPGTTISVTKSFITTSTSPVEIEATEFISLNDNMVVSTYTFEN